MELRRLRLTTCRTLWATFRLSGTTSMARSAAIVISMDAHLDVRASSLRKRGIGKERFFQMLEFAEDVVNEGRVIASVVERGLRNLEAGARLRALRGRMSSFDI